MTTPVDAENVKIKLVHPVTIANLDPGMKNKEGEPLSKTPGWLTLFHELGGHGYLRYVKKDPN